MKREKLMKTSKPPPKPSLMPSIEHYRDLSNLGSLIASEPGMFWCYTHLADLPLSEQSPDPRYCKACNAVLTREREDLRGSGNRKKPWWVPQNGKRPGKDTVVVDNHVPQIMSTLKGANSALDEIDPTLAGTKVKHFKNGITHNQHINRVRKHHQLPVKRNKQLAFDGMGIKEAAKV
jgi:hypothetical protein